MTYWNVELSFQPFSKRIGRFQIKNFEQEEYRTYSLEK